MKRIWIAIVLFLLCFGICVGEQVFINDFCKGLDKIVSEAQKDPSKENLDELHEYWNKKNDMLYTMCQHDMLDEMSISIHEIATSKDKDIIKSALTSIKAQNYTFYENQKITLSNIS